MGGESRRAIGVRWGGLLFAFLLALTVLKGLRMPSRWAVTHYLFTYQFGFIKRGLWGELLRLGFRSWTANYFCLAVVALTILAAFILLIFRETRRLVGPNRIPLLLVFLASPALAYYAHLVGYLEQICYLTWVLILIWARRWRWQVLVAVSVAAAAILPLIHEAAVLWVGGLSALTILTAAGSGRSPKVRLAAVGLVAGVWVTSTLSVVAFGRVSEEKAWALREDRINFFEFRPRTDAFGALSTPLDASLREMRRRWSDPNIRREMFYSAAVFAPGAIFLVALAVRRGRSLDPDRQIQTATTALVVLAVLGPLLLNALGRDEHRWNALAALNAGLAALALAGVRSTSDDAAAESRVGVRVPAFALAVCLWSVSADPAFFDLYGPNHPPFSYQIEFLRDALRTGDRNIWLPGPGR